MTETDRRGFAAELAILAETFAEQVSPVRAEAYFLALSDLPIDAVRTAMRAAIKACRFFPKPAELLDLAGAGVSSAKDRAAVAWAQVLRGLERVGTWSSIDFGDTATHFAIEAMGGWHVAHDWNVLDGFRQAEFTRLYVAYEHTGGKAKVPELLLGQHARMNGGQPYFQRGALPTSTVYRMLPDGAIVQLDRKLKALDAAVAQKALAPAPSDPIAGPTALKALVQRFTAKLPEREKRAEASRLESGEGWFTAGANLSASQATRLE